MKKDNSLHQIKIGAGKSTLIYCFIPFTAVAATWIFFVLFFPTFFGMSAGSSNLFMTLSFIIIPFVMFLLPAFLFLFGYSSKKYQKKYLNQTIEEKKHLVDYYKKMIKQIHREAQKKIDAEIKEIEECIISTDTQCQNNISSFIEKGKEAIETIKKAHDKFNKIKGNEIEIVKKLQFGQEKDNLIEKIDNSIVDAISESNKIEEKMKQEYKDLILQITSNWKKISNDYETEMLYKIVESQKIITDLEEKLKFYI